MRTKVWEHKDFCRLLIKNGYGYCRMNGSHTIYKNEQGKHISVPKKLSIMIARRLIKENNLNLHLI